MPRFKIAHLREVDSNGQEVQLIVVPLDKSFGHKTPQAQQEAVNELQLRAGAANLRGTVCPVWEDGGGRMKFIAPQPWFPYLRSLDLLLVQGLLNRELFW